MTATDELRILRWTDRGASVDALSGLLAAYHLQTEAEKGVAVDGVDDLAPRYRAEVLAPGAAFADAVVLLAFSGDVAVGCVAVTFPAAGQAELKRLWTDPGTRGRGVASALVGAAVAESWHRHADTVRLSVWGWRRAAIALYERLGFTVVAPWDDRDELVCMELRR